MPTPEINKHLADLLLEHDVMQDGCQMHAWLQGTDDEVIYPAEAFEKTQRFFTQWPDELRGAKFEDLVAEAIRRAHADT